MVVVGTHHDVFVLQLLVVAWQHGNDIMGGIFVGCLGDYVFLAECEVLIESLLFLGLDHWLQLQTAQLTDDIR